MPSQFRGYGIWIMTMYFSVSEIVCTGDGNSVWMRVMRRRSTVAPGSFDSLAGTENTTYSGLRPMSSGLIFSWIAQVNHSPVTGSTCGSAWKMSGPPSTSSSLKGNLPRVLMSLRLNSRSEEPTDMEMHLVLPQHCEMWRFPFSLLGGANIAAKRSQMLSMLGLEHVSLTAILPASLCMRWFQVSSQRFLYEHSPSPEIWSLYSIAWPSTQSTNSSSPNSNFAGPACMRLPRSHGGSEPSTRSPFTSTSSSADWSQFLKSMPTW
mmetsp:Transcript_34880/g.94476  ORF Transcript_34880/g.94476 Transcript_34880/m.94476 type:complete len:264 (+) Transcript_34880:867-1658(+)